MFRLSCPNTNANKYGNMRDLVSVTFRLITSKQWPLRGVERRGRRGTNLRVRVAVRREAYASLEMHAREREAGVRVERGQQAAREVLRQAHEVVRVPREVLLVLLLPERRRGHRRLSRLTSGLPTRAGSTLPIRIARVAACAGAGQRAL